MMAVIDGQVVKYVFTPVKQAWQLIMDAGFNRMGDRQKIELVKEYLLPKIK